MCWGARSEEQLHRGVLQLPTPAMCRSELQAAVPCWLETSRAHSSFPNTAILKLHKAAQGMNLCSIRDQVKCFYLMLNKNSETRWALGLRTAGQPALQCLPTLPLEMATPQVPPMMLRSQSPHWWTWTEPSVTKNPDAAQYPCAGNMASLSTWVREWGSSLYSEWFRDTFLIIVCRYAKLPPEIMPAKQAQILKALQTMLKNGKVNQRASWEEQSRAFLRVCIPIHSGSRWRESKWRVSWIN